MSPECSIINKQIVTRYIAIYVHDTKHHNRKLRKVTVITVTNYKYNYNTVKPKLKHEPQNKKSCAQVLVTFQVHKGT